MKCDHAAHEVGTEPPAVAIVRFWLSQDILHTIALAHAYCLNHSDEIIELCLVAGLPYAHALIPEKASVA